MYFDFDDGHPDIQRVPGALTPREGVMLSIIVHLLAVIAILLVPKLPFMQARAQAAEQARLAAIERARELERQQQRRFVFVQPRVDMKALKPLLREAPLSDKDRTAMLRERPPAPLNMQPFSRGNTPEFVEPAPAPPRMARATPPVPPGAQQPETDAGQTDAGSLRLPDANGSTPSMRPGSGAAQSQAQPRSALGEALRNLSQYAERDAFANPNGGQNGAFGPSIQFDTKGVEFGPWIRRFIAQIKRNWFVPQAAMSLRGHVVITFNVHKDGAISDLSVIGPSGVESFNHAAYNALAASNPTYPLPPEYPSERAFFTVTFYYNETPPSP
jgi:TonB family protein